MSKYTLVQKFRISAPGSSFQRLLAIIGYQKLDYNQQTLYILFQSALTASQLNGLTGVPAHTTHLETVYRQGREHLNVVKRSQILLSVNDSSVSRVSYILLISINSTYQLYISTLVAFIVFSFTLYITFVYHYIYQHHTGIYQCESSNQFSLKTPNL